MTDSIARILHLGPHEARRALMLGGVLFALTGSYTLVKTARDALFLSELPATLLPFVFLGVGVVTTVAAAAYARATRGRSTWVTLEWATWVSAIALTAGAYLFTLGAQWVPVAFYLWVNVYGLILMSQFWSYTNSISDPREAKRIFGVIGTGGILGGLFGGLAAPPVAQAFGLSALLLLAAVLLALATPLVRSRIPVSAAPEPDRADGSGTANPLGHAYVRWLAVAALCSVLAATLIDYQFKVEIQARHPTAQGLATFLGLFHTTTNLAALAMQVFATRWALATIGAGWSAAVLPTGLGLGAVATLLAPGFATVVGTRLWDQVMRVSINKSSVELFFFPIPPDLRRRAKAWIEAGLERMGDAVAGLLLLAAGLTIGATTWTIALMVGVAVGVWVVAWMVLRKAYVVELGRNLRRMNLGSKQARVSLRESSVLGEMARLLESPFERVVLHGLEMLEEHAPEQVAEYLPRLMIHSSPRVRARAVAWVGRERIEALRAEVEARVRDEDPEVRVSALRASGDLSGVSPLQSLEVYLAADDVELRRSALLCVAEVVTPDEEDRLRTLLETAAKGSIGERITAAEALGRRPPNSSLLDLLSPLLDDEEVAVRNAVLESAGKTRRRLLIPAMIEALRDRESQASARIGLASFGDGAVGTLGDYLCDAAIPLAIRRELPRVLERIGTTQAVAALFRCRSREDVRISYRVLKAANRIRAHDPTISFPEPLVTEDIEFDVRSYLFALVHYRSCPIGGAHTAERLLCIALNERMDQALNRIFRRLALLYPPAETHAAYQGIVSANPRMRGNALEYVEHALHPAHGSLVLPLVNDSGDEGRLRFAEQRFGMHYVGVVESLHELLEGDDSWLRTCALFVAGSRREHSLTEQIDRNLRFPHAVVRETALWARTALSLG